MRETEHISSRGILQYPDKWDESKILTEPPTASLSIAPSSVETENLFLFGDNFQVLKNLLESHKNHVDLIYIDPPFGTGQEFANRDQNVAYRDILMDHEFLEFLRRRLILMRELLSDQGSLYLHIDKKIGHYVRIIMDEVFGYENFLNDITRIKCNPKNFSRKAYGNYSDMILFYAKNRDQHIWNEVREPLTEEELTKLFPRQHTDFGPYTTHPLHAPGETLNGDTGMEWNGLKPPPGRHWRYSRKVLDELEAAGLIEWSETGNPRKMVFARDHKGKKVQDVWEYKDKGIAYVSYPTEKNHELLARIIKHSSHEGSLVLDAFAGSGGTLMVADALGRKWIGIDQSEQSLLVVKENFASANIACQWGELS